MYSLVLSSLLASTAAVNSTSLDAAYAHAQRLVEVEPDRRLNLYCVGSGSPTVIFESGLAEPTSNWYLVQSAIALKTRTCSYDRAGTGFSDAGKRAGTSAHAVDDLHRLLAAGSIKPPYILVGHSYGGMNARLYAYTYPTEVVGMVLVDPSHEDQSEGYRKLSLKNSSPEAWAALSVPGLEQRRKCIAAAEVGLVPGTDEYKQCIFDPPARFTDPLKAAYLEMQLKPGFHQTQLTEDENIFGASADQLRNAQHSLADMPLVVLTQAADLKPLRSWETRQLREARRRLWLRLHASVAASSSRGVHRVVDNSGHTIQLDQPQAVIDAILEVLKATKRRGPAASALAGIGEGITS